MSFAVKDRFTWRDMYNVCMYNGKQVFKFPSDIVLDLLELYRDYMACENVVLVVKTG